MPGTLRRLREASLALLTVGAGLACGGDGGGVGPEVGPGRVAFIGIDGVPVSRQLYVGRTVNMTAATYDRDHARMSAPVTWTSSDTTVARVQEGGSYGYGTPIRAAAVTGISPGSVTITVASDGQTTRVPLEVVVVPAAAVRLVPSGAAAYVGLKTQLSATVLDSSGSAITGHRVVWSSSAPSIVAIDNTGLATARAQGEATITATAGGKSAVATVTVLPRPSSDWTSVAQDWTTFQGNPSHTGYVPATLDPVLFDQRWVANVAPGELLNPVTAGDGKVFASTNSYFGDQQVLVALNATTGGQLWSRHFAGYHSVHPPAYASGTAYVTTGGHEDSFIWAFDANSGAVRFRTPYGNQWSRYFAPVIVGDALYMAGGAYDGMYSFSTTDGTQRWFAPTNQYDEWTPAVRDGLVYAYTGSYNPRVQVVHAATGALAYEIPDPRFEWGGWSMRIAPVLGASNNLLATQGGRLISFDLQNRRIGWEHAGAFSGSVTVANGVLYVLSSGQVEARRESDGVRLWTWVPPEGSLQGTTIATKNLLLVSTAANTYAVDLAARVHSWSYPAGGHLALSRDGVLFIAQANGKLAAITVR